MNIEAKKISTLNELLEIAKERKKGDKKTLEKHYGCLIRGIDGLEYQKACRCEWN